MKINLARSAGFCSGVRRALKIAREAADAGGKVYMLGDIVHNEDVLADMDALGIERVVELKDAGGATLLICAHGVPRDTMEHARALGYRIVDATCPMVKDIHKAATAFESEGRTVIVIGDVLHDEVKGIVGQLSTEALVVSDPADLPVSELERIDRAGVVVQSTQNIANVEKILQGIRDRVADVRFENTICGPTTRKQTEIADIATMNDVVVIIGSRNSANTRRLYEIASAKNPRTHWIRTVDQLEDDWFNQAETVGVGAGASTPDEVTMAVVRYLEELETG